ncbi:archaetidylserine decarboxylase [Comamonas flocculans]|uniref:Phosphatidylserine decarboxylase proenzyme n=1 Tax=Comamonas flocculans TaxID=2597701 RepID=A0A5B8RZC7_9BURK|nr:archaetidylserine decarboxylase [Comamonas flocculans]QEA14082.1 phosphatidylserine decarboxylase [Comamonas flocculans]
MSDRLAIALQHLAPKQALTQLAGYGATAQGGRWTTAVIRWFVQRYGVDMAEAAQPDIAAYPSFNAFFTRALKPDARPLATCDLICPVDGQISQFGSLRQGRLLQAKGHDYSATALLGADAALAARFDDGLFATLYLSPRDYHRVHMPCRGRLLRMRHVPGSLYSVNPVTARHVPGLFARNERVVCLFDTDFGPMAMVLVGATIVGSICTSWHGQVNPPRGAPMRHWDYTDQDIVLAQGQEMGRFQLGSTVIVLLPRGELRWSENWSAPGAVRMGEAMAHRPCE